MQRVPAVRKSLSDRQVEVKYQSHPANKHVSIVTDQLLAELKYETKSLVNSELMGQISHEARWENESLPENVLSKVPAVCQRLAEGCSVSMPVVNANISYTFTSKCFVSSVCIQMTRLQQEAPSDPGSRFKSSQSRVIEPQETDQMHKISLFVYFIWTSRPDGKFRMLRHESTQAEGNRLIK